MTAYTISVAPYVDLDYVVGGYVDDSFALGGVDAELRSTGGIFTGVTPYTFTGSPAALTSNRIIPPAVRAFTLSGITSGLSSSRFQRAHVTPFTLSGVTSTVFTNRRSAAETAQFFLFGVDIIFGRPTRPIQDGLGFSTDLSDQSKDYERLRRGYGGSDNTPPSFLRPQYVRFNSLSKSKDLGDLQALDAEYRGRIGAEVGSATIHIKINLLESAKINYKKLPASNRFDDKQVSIGLLDSARKSIPLDDLGFARPSLSNQQGDLSASGQEAAPQYLPPGTYYFLISSSQWRACDYGVKIFIGGLVSLSGTTSFELDTTARIALARLAGTATLENTSFATVAQTRLLSGAADTRLEPTLTLTRTSPYSTG